MQCCELCRSVQTEKRVHVNAMDEYCSVFQKDYNFAQLELSRLQQLVQEVMWYNFETVAKNWGYPWPASILDSALKLHGQRYYCVKSKSGRSTEKAEFPCYYYGATKDAPPLPPEIVLSELKLAYEYTQQCAKNCNAPYDYAPGGREYETLLRTSAGVKAFENISKRVCGSANGGHGLKLCDLMERAY